MGDSDLEEESFTFGSFTLEDTREFKKNYSIKNNDVLGRSGTPQQKNAGNDLGKTSLDTSCKRNPDLSPRDGSSAGVLEVSLPSMKEGSEAETKNDPPAVSAAGLLERMPAAAAEAKGEAAVTPSHAATDEVGPAVPRIAPAKPKTTMSWAQIAARSRSSAETPSSGGRSTTPSVARDIIGEEMEGRQNGTGEDIIVSGASDHSRIQGPLGLACDESNGYRIRDGKEEILASSGRVHPGTGAALACDREASSSPVGPTQRPSDGESCAPDDALTRDRKSVNEQPEDLELSEAIEKASKVNAEAEAAERSMRAWQFLLQLLGSESPEAALTGGSAGFVSGPGVDLIRRGLVNTGNSCFRSVILQALLACEPFVGILFRAAPSLRDSEMAQEALPTWAQMARFASAFEPPRPGAQVDFGVSSGTSVSGSSGGRAWSTPVSKGRGRFRGGPAAPEPVLPDEAMSRAFGAFRSANTGEQEDAQEFLAFFLDQLHEEIVKAKKLYASSSRDSLGGGIVGDSVGDEERGTRDSNSWMEVGKGRSKAVVNARGQKDDDSSAITGLFYGMFRSEVRKGGSSKTSVTLEPFHCLQLDLDPPSSSTQNPTSEQPTNGAWASPPKYSNGYATANGKGGMQKGEGGGQYPVVGRGGFDRGASGTGTYKGQKGGNAVSDAWGSGSGGSQGPPATVLDEALAALFGGEAVAGVKGRQNMEVKASRTLTLEQAPRVLTLHMKQFSYHPDIGPRKLGRRVRYPLELVVPSRLMSPSLQRQADKQGPLKYRLFTVVLHHGRSLHGGHYTALVRDGRSEWRHCDDQSVYPEAESQALNPASGHPYLLLYTRI